MKREFLKSLGLTDEQIDNVISENGKDIEKHKTATDKASQDVEKIKSELDGVKTQLEEANIQIQGFKDMDIEGIKKSADDWKAKYESDTKKLQEEMQSKEFGYVVDRYLDGHEFISDFAKKAFKQEFLGKEFKLDSGKLLGADEFIEQFKQANEGVFKTEKQPEQKQEIKQPQPTPYIYNPKGGAEGGEDLAKIALDAVRGI